MPVPPWVKVPVLLKDNSRGRSNDVLIDAKTAEAKLAKGEIVKASSRLIVIQTTNGLMSVPVYRRIRKRKNLGKERTGVLRGTSATMSPRRPDSGGKVGDSAYEKILDSLVSGNRAPRRAVLLLNAWR